MKKLIKKEVAMNGYIIFSILMLPIFSLVIPYENKAMSYISFSFFVAFLSVYVIANIISYEKNEVLDRMFLSLPVDREDLVKSKYIVYSIFPLLASAYLYFYMEFIRWPFVYNYENIDIDVIIFSTAISLILMGLLIPLFFLLTKRIHLVFFVLHTALLANIFFPRWFPEHFTFRVIDTSLDISINFALANLLLALLAIIINLISIKLSRIIIEKRWAKK